MIEKLDGLLVKNNCQELCADHFRSEPRFCALENSENIYVTYECTCTSAA